MAKQSLFEEADHWAASWGREKRRWSLAKHGSEARTEAEKWLSGKVEPHLNGFADFLKGQSKVASTVTRFVSIIKGVLFNSFCRDQYKSAAETSYQAFLDSKTTQPALADSSQSASSTDRPSAPSRGRRSAASAGLKRSLSSAGTKAAKAARGKGGVEEGTIEISDDEGPEALLPPPPPPPPPPAPGRKSKKAPALAPPAAEKKGKKAAAKGAKRRRTQPRSNDEFWESAECMVCKSSEREEELLLCDTEGCPHSCHLGCCEPPLTSVPEGEWFCSRCAPPPEPEVAVALPEGHSLDSAAGSETAAPSTARPLDAQVAAGPAAPDSLLTQRVESSVDAEAVSAAPLTPALLQCPVRAGSFGTPLQLSAPSTPGGLESCCPLCESEMVLCFRERRLVSKCTRPGCQGFRNLLGPRNDRIPLGSGLFLPLSTLHRMLRRASTSTKPRAKVESAEEGAGPLAEVPCKVEHEAAEPSQALEGLTLLQQVERLLERTVIKRQNRARVANPQRPKLVTLGLIRDRRTGKFSLSAQTKEHEELTKLICRAAAEAMPDFHFSTIQVVEDHQTPLHIDENAGPTIAACVGDFTGGSLYVDGTGLQDLKYNWVEFDSSRVHATELFEGHRYVVTCFPHKLIYSLTRTKGRTKAEKKALKHAKELGFPLPSGKAVPRDWRIEAAMKLVPRELRDRLLVRDEGTGSCQRISDVLP